MLNLQKLRTKEADIKRWELLKYYSWDTDFETIQYIANVTNYRFFTSRTIEELKTEVNKNIEFDKFINNK